MPIPSQPAEPAARPALNRLCLAGLLAITLICLWPVGGLGFTGYDDVDYVFQNPHVQAGLSGDNIGWAFTSASVGVWHPLTWLSLMLDCELFGVDPHEEHWINLGLHAATTLLLFVLLQQWTGARWRSFFVAALFGIHPLHVQSVAWISERKDVLSAFFCILTLLAYTRYCRSKARGDYFLMLGLFALGLMSKPMLVTLPAVMLLADFWPLRRIPFLQPSVFSLQLFRVWRPLLIEKIPLFALCLISCVVAIWAEKTTNTVVSAQSFSWEDRGLNAILSYALYLGKIFWPVNLAIFYPLPRERANEIIYLGAALLLIVLSLISLRWARRQPWLLAGWLWFFVMLLPVIGLVQIGLQSMADRYVYLPSIGLFIIVAWGLAEIAGNSRSLQITMAGLGSIMVLACALDSRHQLSFWRNDVVLFKHVVEVSPDNDYMGYFYLGISHAEAGDLPAAADCLKRALAAKPEFALARSRLGNVLFVAKKYAEAEVYLREVAQSHPNDVPARMTLGLDLAGQCKFLDAQAEFEAARQLRPDDPGINQILEANRPKADAMSTLAKQSGMNATAEVHSQLAQAQAVLGNYAEAVHQYDLALAQKSDDLASLNNLAWLLATCSDATVRNGPQAMSLAHHACELTDYKKTMYLGTLAAACAEAGRFDEAIATAQKACTNATILGESDLLERNQELLSLYQEHQAWHEPAEKLVPAAP